MKQSDKVQRQLDAIKDIDKAFREATKAGEKGYWSVYRHLPVATQNAIFDPCPRVKYPSFISDGLVSVKSLPKNKRGKKK